MRNDKGQFVKGHHWRPPQPFRDRDWLVREYVGRGRSTGDIARQFGVTDAAVLFWLRKHKIPRRDVSAARKLKRWGSVGVDNPMWNRKGELNPNWKGGVTPERQAFYASGEWKKVCSLVWKRDKATCQRCGLYRTDQPDMPFHIHHIRSFAFADLRAIPSNLVLLCEVCHQFVHSRENVAREYLPEGPDTAPLD
jgi:hypothetical protein